MLNRIKTEPAMVTALVLAVIGVLASFGLGITDGQSAAIVALVGAVLSVVGGATIRSQVTPTATLNSAKVPDDQG